MSRSKRCSVGAYQSCQADDPSSNCSSGCEGRGSMSVRTGILILVIMTIGCDRSRDPRAARFPASPDNYRLLKDSDFCGGLPLFSTPDPATMIGTVLDGAREYVDPRTDGRFPAIRVLSVVHGKRVDRWYRRDQLVGRVWVLSNDPRFGRCGYWFEEARPVRPTAKEIPAY